MGGGARRSPPPAARENHVIRWFAERGGDREGIGATAPESANHRITWFSPATGRGARLSPPPISKAMGRPIKVWAKRRIFDFFLSIIMYDHPQNLPLWNSLCVKYYVRKIQNPWILGKHEIQYFIVLYFPFFRQKISVVLNCTPRSEKGRRAAVLYAAVEPPWARARRVLYRTIQY